MKFKQKLKQLLCKHQYFTVLSGNNNHLLKEVTNKEIVLVKRCIKCGHCYIE
jgi:hypothetical protein